MKIEITGIKSLSIQNLFKVTYDEILQAAAISGNALKYCNGMLFAITGFNQSEKMKEDEAVGIYNFQIVAYADAPAKKYEPVIKHNDSNTNLPVMDFSKVKFYSELEQFCKSQGEKK